MTVNFIGSRRSLSCFERLLSDIDTPKSLALSLALRAGDYTTMFSLIDIDPRNYADARSLALDRQACDFLKKSPQFLADDVETKTLELFRACEERCREVNRRWRYPRKEYEVHNDDLAVMQSKIASILDELPVELDYGFGPGVSMTVRGDDTGAYAKYLQAPVDVTNNARPFAENYLNGSLWGDFLKRSNASGECTTVVDNSRTAQVPKSYKINRLIATEPTFNTYVQKGLGTHIRKRLMRSGVDLRQQSHNQWLASKAQSRGLATVDFTSASDTISHGTVLHLLPTYWFAALEMFRTPSTEINGELHVLQKFSSMGNGYTFELESLIFYAAAFAVVSRGSGEIWNISVYGDDVILPQADFPAFRDLCQFLGFTLSSEKSFVTGRFFESCGRDYFDGIDVRPNYLKSDLVSDYDVFTCRNRLLAFYDKWDITTRTALQFLEGKVPVHRRLFVPRPYAGGFWPSVAQDVGFEADKNGWEGVWARAMSWRSRERPNTVFEPALLHSLSSPSGGFRPLRRSGRHVVRKTFFPSVASLS